MAAGRLVQGGVMASWENKGTTLKVVGARDVDRPSMMVQVVVVVRTCSWD